MSKESKEESKEVIAIDNLVKLDGEIKDFNLERWINEYITLKGKAIPRSGEPPTSPGNDTLQSQIERQVSIEGVLHPFYKPEFYVFLNNITVKHTIGEGSCLIHAIFTSISESYRRLIGNNERDFLIEMVADFRRNVLVRFYKKGAQTVRVGETLDNDTFIMDNSTFLENSDLQRISEVAHINFITISVNRLNSGESGFVQFISGKNILDNTDAIHKDWPIVIVYNAYGTRHWESCKYTKGNSQTYLLNYTDLGDVLVGHMLNLIRVGAQAVGRKAENIGDTTFLQTVNIKIAGRPDTFTFCGAEKQIDRDNNNYILGLKFNNLKIKRDGATMIAIIPFKFLTIDTHDLHDNFKRLLATITAEHNAGIAKTDVFPKSYVSKKSDLALLKIVPGSFCELPAPSASVAAGAGAGAATTASTSASSITYVSTAENKALKTVVKAGTSVKDVSTPINKAIMENRIKTIYDTPIQEFISSEIAKIENIAGDKGKVERFTEVVSNILINFPLEEDSLYTKTKFIEVSKNYPSLKGHPEIIDTVTKGILSDEIILEDIITHLIHIVRAIGLKQRAAAAAKAAAEAKPKGGAYHHRRRAILTKKKHVRKIRKTTRKHRS